MLARLATLHGEIADTLRSERFWVLFPVEGAVISQPFGARPEYYSQWFRDKDGNPLGHEGIDLWMKDIFGKPILAGFDGQVYRVENTDSSNYGIQVRIQNKCYKAAYAHMSKTNVKVGDVVQRGDVLGWVGNTGNSSAAHTHLTLRKNGATASGESAYVGVATDIVDPTPFLRKS